MLRNHVGGCLEHLQYEFNQRSNNLKVINIVRNNLLYIIYNMEGEKIHKF